MDRAAKIVERHVYATWMREAKPQYLKAIDYTIGLVKRLVRMGIKIDEAKVMPRLLEMRAATQQGIRLDTVFENKKLIEGKGMHLLIQMEKQEHALLPTEKDYAAFTQEFPNQGSAHAKKQGAHLLGMIEAKLGVERKDIEPRLLYDQAFFNEAYDVCLPEFLQVHGEVVSLVNGKVPGHFKDRPGNGVKEAKSAFGKQTRDKEKGPTPFIYFKDMVGVTSVVDTVRELCEAARVIQSAFQLSEKKNYFLRNVGYNAINYNLSNGMMMFEIQLKTNVNAAEAALTHDLIYAKEKRVYELSNAEKALVAKVIEVSTQLSMRDWQEAFGVAVKTAHQSFVRTAL